MGAWTPIQWQTTSTTTATVTFSSIPSGYKDLMVVVSGTATGATQPSLNLNGDATAGNYACVMFYAPAGGGVPAGGTGSTTYSVSAVDTNAFVETFHLLDYTATDKNKTMLIRHNAPGRGVTEATALRWSSTAAVTSWSFTAASWAAGTTFALYGIAG